MKSKFVEDIKERFTTQGGGVVEWNDIQERFIFVESPDCCGLEVGDFMPEEWGLGGEVKGT